jgi:hypothetical protein
MYDRTIWRLLTEQLVDGLQFPAGYQPELGRIERAAKLIGIGKTTLYDALSDDGDGILSVKAFFALLYHQPPESQEDLLKKVSTGLGYLVERAERRQ